MTSECTYEQHHRWTPPPVWLYCMATAVYFSIVSWVRAKGIAVPFGSLAERRTGFLLMVVDSVRVFAAMFIARDVRERGLVVRVHRSLRVEDVDNVTRLRVDGREWSCSEVREVGLETGLLEPSRPSTGRYGGVLLLMTDCLIVVCGVTSPDRATSIAEQLGSALSRPVGSVFGFVRSGQLGATFWVLFRWFSGAMASQVASVWWLAAAWPQVADALLIVLHWSRRQRSRNDLIARGLLPTEVV